MQKRLQDSRQEIQTLEKNLAVVRTESLTDTLTTLANRKFFNNAIHRLLAEAAAKNSPLSVVLTDIDHFKNFNDTYGHLTGDQVLRLVAGAVKQEIKGQDIAARYGGEEFAILLPRTALTQAVTVADHIRRSVMRKELIRRSTGESLGRVTISLGVATWRKGDTISSLMERADACLYPPSVPGATASSPRPRSTTRPAARRRRSLDRPSLRRGLPRFSGFDFLGLSTMRRAERRAGEVTELLRIVQQALRQPPIGHHHAPVLRAVSKGPRAFGLERGNGLLVGFQKNLAVGHERDHQTVGKNAGAAEHAAN